MRPRYTRHTPAKLPKGNKSSLNQPQNWTHPPRTPRQVACSFVLNAVTGQFDDYGNKQQQFEAAEDKEAVGFGGADCLVVDLLQGLARVLLTPHFPPIHDVDVVVLEKKLLKCFDVVAIAAPRIAGQEEFCALLRSKKAAFWSETIQFEFVLCGPVHDWLEGL